MTKKRMTRNAARRIQSHSDRTGKNPGFKARAMKAAAKNKNRHLDQEVSTRMLLALPENSANQSNEDEQIDWSPQERLAFAALIHSKINFTKVDYPRFLDGIKYLEKNSANSLLL